MSEVDLDAELAVETPDAPTSRLAVGSALSALICIPGLSGLLGILLGVLALRQMGTARLSGARLAWTGIVGGALNLFFWAPVGNHVLEVSHALSAPTERFMTAWMQSERAGEEAAAPGLRPLMHHGEGELLRHALQERLGAYRGVGAPGDFHYAYHLAGEQASARFPLLFASGAPAWARFDYVRVQGELQVVGFVLDSPLLADLRARSALHGAATPTLREFEGPESHTAPELKTYRP